ncbi:hypothetical protein [Sphingomonas sp. MMS24-J13]|uniref:hypothetical protein n=1 Tax=Sphingomonas sp. MMS24-J13 TaxID=3238686 RepID=UPI00384F3799
MNQSVQANENEEVPDWSADAGEAVPDSGHAMWEAPAPSRHWPTILVCLLLGLFAISWIVALAIGIAQATPPEGLPLLKLAAWIGLGSGPLALFAILYLLLLRSGRAEANAYSRAAARLRADSESLAGMLALMTRQIEEGRSALSAQAGELQALGNDASARLGGTAADLRSQAQAFGAAATTFESATTLARADLGVLMTDLPQAEEVARLLGEKLREGSAEADKRIRTFNELLAELETRARAASEGTGGAAARLAGQLDRIEAAAAAADRRIEDAAISMGRAVDITMETVAEGVDETRRVVGEQSAALTALMAQGQANIGTAGEDAVRILSARLDALVSRIDAIGAGLSGQEEAGRGLLDRLEQTIAAVETRLAALGEAGVAHTAGLSETVIALADNADAVSRSLGGSSQAADTLLGRVTQLRVQAEASSVAICETIPSALSRIRLHAEQSLQAISGASQRADGLSEAITTVGEKLTEADALLQRQKGALDEVGTLAGERLAGLHEQTAALEALLVKADEQMRSLTEGTTGNLIEALLRVRETATQASDHARDAISAVIPRVAQRLSESAARALSQAISEVGQTEMAGIGAASEQAIESARLAAERLTRQLVTIAETSTAIDARIAENREQTEAHDEANFARSVSLLIEALNSTAIDVAKIFSNEVTDEQWKAYLRGDRGIFTRRAVRLLDRVEVGVIAGRYGEDAEFHEQVNRYIHDFEALLRRVMATKDGTPIATTMLSSDAGKLYVALAQAIERLRR